MNRIQFKNWVVNNSEEYPTKLIILIYNIIKDLNLYIVTLTGYIPSHAIRYLLYKYFFQVKIFSNCIIYWRRRFFQPSGVSIGHNSIIGNDAFLDGRSGLDIGNNVNIGEFRAYTMEDDISDPHFSGRGASVEIRDWAYIGTRVTVLPGVVIEEGAILSSGSVVTKNVKLGL